MIFVAHLLDDFGMGGVTRALTLFDQPQLEEIAESTVVQVDTNAMLAPVIAADVIVDHMAVSWRRLPFLASLRARNPRARILRVEHSYTKSFEASRVRSKMRFRALLRAAASLSDGVVCVSRAQQEWMEKSVGVRADKLHTIYPWSGRTELLDIQAKPGSKAAPMQLLAYGRYADVKNFGELIQGMRSFKPEQVQLTLYGDGPQRSELEQLAADMPHVQVLGPQSDPTPWLSQSDAVIMPSQYEAFGLVATEARMAGRAVIAADVDGLTEQIADNGIVAKLRNAEDIAGAIRLAMNSPLAAMGTQAREGVLGQHDEIIRNWRSLLANAAA